MTFIGHLYVQNTILSALCILFNSHSNTMQRFYYSYILKVKILRIGQVKLASSSTAEVVEHNGDIYI
jgi:hypothetical protein